MVNADSRRGAAQFQHDGPRGLGGITEQSRQGRFDADIGGADDQRDAGDDGGKRRQDGESGDDGRVRGHAALSDKSPPDPYCLVRARATR